MIGEQRLEPLLDEAFPVGVFKSDAHGQMIYVNEYWSFIVGLNAEEAKGMGWVQGIHPEDRDSIQSSWERAIQDELPFQIEYRLQKANGKITWVLGKAVAEHDPNGTLTGYLGTLTDITARKRTEQVLIKQLACDRLVLQISDTLSKLSHEDIDTGIAQVLQELGLFAHADICLLSLFSDKEALSPSHIWEAKDEGNFKARTHTMLETALPWTISKIRLGEQVSIARVSTMPITASIDKAFCEDVGLYSLLFSPLIHNNIAVGWFGFAYTQQEKSFADVPPHSLRMLGEILMNALQRKESEKSLYQYQNHLEDLVTDKTAKLHESEKRFRTMADTAPVMILISDVDHKFEYFNEFWLNFTGIPIEAAIEKGWIDRIHPNDLDHYLHAFKSASEGYHSFRTEYRLKNFELEYRWILHTSNPRFLPNGEFQGYISSCIDITEQKYLEQSLSQALSQEKELAQITLESIGDAVITTNKLGQILYCNPVAESLTGLTFPEAKAKPLYDIFVLVDEHTLRRTNLSLTPVLEEGSTIEIAKHSAILGHDGHKYGIEGSISPILDHEESVLGSVLVFRDVTQARLLTSQLSWQANHDILTGLVNRRYFEEKIEQCFHRIHQEDHKYVLCYLDLDQFKIVNDTCGHIAGDELLQQISKLLNRNIRSADTLARLGGDEFGVLLNQCPLEKAITIAEHMLHVINNFRFVWQNRVFRVGISIGLVTIDKNSVDLSSVLSSADAACYAAKNKGRNRIQVYRSDDILLTQQRQAQQWSIRIWQAFENGRFQLFHQPLQNAHNPNDVHHEILLRMIDLSGNIIPPSVFIPAAERYDLMPVLDRWVVQTFFEHLRNSSTPSSDKTPSDYSLHAINLSGMSLNDDTFLGFLKAELSHPGICAEDICFEITETAAIANLNQAALFMNEVKEFGCKFSLDDFGSGMSSFGYLKSLPVDFLKIDGSFITDLDQDPTTYVIVESINKVGHLMGLKTVAEWVESASVMHKLKEIGVDYLQGYHIGKPQCV